MKLHKMHGTTWYSGRNGAQDVMFREAGDDEFFVCLQRPWRCFASYRDLRAFLEHYQETTEEERHFYEIIGEGKACRIFLDIEWEQHLAGETPSDEEVKEAVERVRDIVDLVCAMLSRMGVECSRNDDFCVLEGSRGKVDKWKFSFHVIGKDVYFENNERALKRFMEGLRAGMEVAQEVWMFCPTSGKPIVDFGTNTKNRQMRIIGSTKYGDTQPLVSIHGIGSCITNAFITKSPVDEHWMVTEGEVEEMIAGMPEIQEIMSQWGVKTKRKREPSGSSEDADKMGQRKRETPVESRSDDSIYEIMTRLIRELGDHASEITHEVKSNDGEEEMRVFVGRNGGVRRCPWGEEHDSNNFYLVVHSDGQVNYHCHGSDKLCSKAKMCIGNIIDPVADPSSGDEIR